MSRSKSRRSATRSNRRKRNRKLLAFGLAALAFVAIVLALVLSNGYQNQSERREDTSTSSPVSSPTSSSEASTRSAVQPDEDKLMDELVRFVEAYYHIDPDETTASRLAAVDELGTVISNDVRIDMDFTVYVNDDLNQTRINSQLTQSGKVEPQDITILSRQQNGRVVYASAPVALITTWRDGSVYGKSAVTIGTVWQCQEDGSWVMTAFGENGDAT